jgi:hypothetical protein
VDVPQTIECFVYNGDNVQMKAKLEAEASFVHYFVAVEAEQYGTPYNMEFSMNRNYFASLSKQLVYLPVRNLPHRKPNLSPQEARENRRVLEDACTTVFEVLAHEDDVLIFSNITDILKKEAVDVFQSSQAPYACTEQLVYLEYFNRMSMRNEGERQGISNSWEVGSRLTRLKTLQESFENSPYLAHNADWCSNKAAHPEVPTIKEAGWSLLLRDTEYAEELLGQEYGEVLTYDINAEYGYLPDAMVAEMKEKGVNSPYARYFSRLSKQRADL